ncbi:protein translocase subunit SecD [Streptomyces sp. NBC_01808]|uniref:protein translocase subunit SecD n=1 Tax=Streptomyces sp. NBC_01808 TaxID=2975947 RepID=UPI002DDC32D0|nr:protein translocase subunit SecD [Streptomyces sp. NBC_01808]WSA36714.1 protein translocase subunit SecD [Streptomyces sp. NBC_01808]
MAAPKTGRRSQGSHGRPWRPLLLILTAIAALTGGMFLSGHTAPRLGIDLAGGTSITLEAKPQPGGENAINSTNMDTAVNIIERRVNGLGVQEAEVQTQGDRHIIVNIPKGTDQKTAREQVGTTARLFFRPVLSYEVNEAPKPSPSASESGGKEKDKDKDKDASSSPSPSETASDKASDDASPSDGATEQGRALSEGLAQADDSPSPTESQAPPAETPPAEQAPTGQVSADVQKKLDALDCSNAEERTKIGENAKPTDTVVACDSEGAYKYALGPAEVEGTDVDDASATYDAQQGSGWIVQLEFNGKGSDKFADVTGTLAGQAPPNNQFAIELDGEVVSAPSVDESITGGRAQISGSFNQESAEELANVLSYGALPLSFEESEVTTVSPALGNEQLQAGLIAGAVGLALVIIYLVAYYRGLALVAVVSLMVSAALTYTIMALLGPGIGFALNLPAVCGAIVAIGITADSFIVYFERIRDEIREGRTLRPAVARGWPRARRTILVSDFVSFLAAAVLFAVTVGKVQGFAFTLGLTTLLDVVVVFLFTKPVMTILARKRFFASGHPWSGLDPKRLGARPPLRGRPRTAGPVNPKEV